MERQRINRLVVGAKLRTRLQRLVEVLCTAALPTLVLAAIAVLLAKRRYLETGELMTALVVLGVVVAVAGVVALLWPISTLETLIRLDRANDFSDRLSSAHAFMELPENERSPEMALHIQRTADRLDVVRIAPASPFRRPNHLIPALVLGGVLAFVWFLEEPGPAMIPSAMASIPPPRLIVDLAALRPEMRQLDALEDLADRSEEPELQAAYEELASIMDRLERGTIGEEELLDRLDDVDRRLDRVEYDEPIDMAADWAEIADELRAVAEEQGLAEEVEDVLGALESGEEQPFAQALEQLAELLESEELSGEDSAELADAIEQIASAIEAGDDELREQIEAYREQIEELQQQLEERDSRRNRRALERLMERLAEAEEDLLEQLADMGQNGALREAIAEALQDAAEALREPRSSGETSESGTAPHLEPGDGEEPASPQSDGSQESDEQASREPPEGQQTDGQQTEGEQGESSDQAGQQETRDPSQASEQRSGEQGDGSEQSQEGSQEQQTSSSTEGQSPGQEGEAGEQQAGGEEQAGSGQQQAGEPQSGDNEQASGEQQQSGQSETQQGSEGGDPSDDGSQGQPTTAPNQAQQRASDSLSQAAEQVQDIDRDSASEEGQERAQNMSERLRENLQRSSQEPIEQNSGAEQTWDDFMDRANGNDPSEQDGDNQRSGAGEEGGEESGGEGEGQGAQAPSDEPSDGSEAGEESSWGTEEGGEALGQESTELDSSRDRVTVEGEDAAEGGGSTSEVIESSAGGGFASRGYREVYQEYAEAAEAALEAEEVPAGFAGFIRNYFDLIEPR